MQCRQRWLGHVCRTADGGISEDALWFELATGTKPIGRTTLRYKGGCKCDLLADGVNPATLEAVASDHATCWSTVTTGIYRAELKK